MVKKNDNVEVLKLDFNEPHWRRDLEMERLLAAEGLDFDYVKVPATKFSRYFEASDLAGQEQVRSSGSTPSIVSQYRESLLLGEKLPAGTASKDLMPVDFYHRGKAANEAGITDFILIRIKDDITPWQRQVIATMRNNMHGARMSDKDTMVAAQTAIDRLGWTIEEAARKLRIDVSTLRRAQAIRAAEDRARKLGVEPKFVGLKRTVQGDLANTKLNDGPFKGLVNLLDENPVSAAKASEIIKDVRDQASDRKAADRIKQIRQDLTPPTLPTIGGAAPVSGARVGGGNGAAVTTVKGASKAFLDAHGSLKAVLTDESTVTALLQASPTDAAYPRIKKALEDMREPFEKLVAHYS